MTERAAIEAQYAAAIAAHQITFDAVENALKAFREGRMPAADFIKLKDADKAALEAFHKAFDAMAALPEIEDHAPAATEFQPSLF